MPDRRRHRGAHPDDGRLFAPAQQEALAIAVDDLSWLLGRGYADVAALALVGDRFRLTERQRVAVRRAACSDAARADRARRHVAPADAAGRALRIDGFNVLVTLEAAFAGGVLLRCRDGTLRDMASMHGSYRRVAETDRAIATLHATAAALAPGSVEVLLDRPVSNSGRLAARIRDAAPDWNVAVVDDPDRELIASRDALVATADAGILDRCEAWIDLASIALADHPAVPLTR